jgi:hypothetical protein
MTILNEAWRRSPTPGFRLRQIAEPQILLMGYSEKEFRR